VAVLIEAIGFEPGYSVFCFSKDLIGSDELLKAHFVVNDHMRSPLFICFSSFVFPFFLIPLVIF
jgi:hypothetical protein